MSVPEVDESSSLARDKPYLPLRPRDLSLECCAGDNMNFCLAFTADCRLPFESLIDVGQYSEKRILLNHANVYWLCSLRLTRVQNDSFALTMKSEGVEEECTKDYPFPRIVEADVILTANDETTKDEYDLRYTDTRRVYSPAKQFTQEELRRFADESGRFRLSLRLVIPRSFFALESFIDLRPAGRLSSAEYTVQAILAGQRPRSSDLKLKGDGADARVYRCHRSAFQSSPRIAEQLQGMPIGEVTTIRSLSERELRMVIPVAYGVEMPLPVRVDNLERITNVLHGIFRDHFFDIVLPQWERAICRLALAIDPLTPSSSMVDILHLLHVIWAVPEGECPMAKRIAIGVLADMAHLNTRTSLQQWVDESVLPHLEESGCDRRYVDAILNEFYEVTDTVPYVEKTMVRLLVDDWPTVPME